MNNTHIHFIGIGGIGMSALAHILNAQGHKITGSDPHKSAITTHLEEKGIQVIHEQSTTSLPSSTTKVVVSNAISHENPEYQEAQKRNLPIKTLSQALGEASKDHTTIIICGTHGKSTTTAMTSKILIEQGFDPTVFIGTKTKELNGNNYRVGKSPYFIIEACEYKESFLNLHPTIVAITNIEPDHLDYFKTEENYLNTYKKLLEKLSKQNTVIINAIDSYSQEIVTYTPAKIVTFDHRNSPIPLSVPGDHNQQNAHTALEIAKVLECPPEKAITSLSSFQGTWRRFEEKGKLGNTLIIDDYAHHPTEIKATLQATREKFPNSKIACVFQPHQYNRTHQLLDEFKTAFTQADTVIIPNIYQVRDTQEDLALISPESFVEELKSTHADVIYGNGLNNTSELLKEIHGKYDIILTMGAGDITTLSNDLLN